MAVQILVDSASDLLQAQAQAWGIRVLPLPVRFGEREFADGVELSHREFYEKLIESDTLPTTSQLPPAAFEAVFQQVVDAGDTAVVVTLSGKLSGTYQSAMIAAQDYAGRVFVVDSETVSIGQRILALRGAQLREEGLDAAAIAARLQQEKRSIRLLALLDTLEYLKRGGRISAATAFAGGLLSIKPVLTVEDGQVVLVGKARGSQQGNNLLRQQMARCGGVDFTKPYCLAYSGLSDALLQKYMADSADLWQGRVSDLPVSTIGCAIGTHVGPGAIAVAFFAPQEGGDTLA